MIGHWEHSEILLINVGVLDMHEMNDELSLKRNMYNILNEAMILDLCNIYY